MTSKFFSFFKPTGTAKPVDPPEGPIAQARALHQQGQLEAALALYGEVLAAHPDSAEAHYRRANVLRDQGALEAAVAGYDQAISLQPDYAHALCNRAVVLGQLQRVPEALASYDRAIAVDPTDALAQCNRAMLLIATGQKDAALVGFDSAIAHNANLFPAHFGRAALLQEQKQWSASLASYDQAVALNAGDILAQLNRAIVLRQLERWTDAVSSYDRVIALNSGLAPAHTGRADALQALNRLPEALDSYDRALNIHSNDATSHAGRGVALQKMGRLEAALASYDQASAADPNYPEACFNRGTALADLRDFEAASASYRQAIAIRPEYAEAHLNLALNSLKLGDYRTGWVEYEWRWRANRGPIHNEERTFRQPLWLGEDSIAGKTILLHGEQGLGDSLQFCRFAERVTGLGARVMLEVPRPLSSLCVTLRGVTQVIAHGDPLPDFDVHCPLMSLPLALKVTLDTVATEIPYLKSDPRKAAAWQERLGPKVKPRIGLTWSGSVGARTYSARSYPLAKLVAYLPDGFEYVGLQTEITEADRKTLADHPAIRQFDGELRDFSDTAALCECLDLVITMDTSATHLAGALGKKAWVLVPFDGDWRWLVDRADSPWYPIVRVFRQTVRGDWDGVFKRVAEELRAEYGR
jgi:tetratricopeptide (TPR) repeat protein